jgi:hypothetical protein
MKTARILLAAACLLALAGCYAASIDTGRTPSAKVISKPWASCWIYGLVPPPVVKTATECPDGVAKVETQHSFLNSLVGGLTFGLYTPMQIVVTCAEAQKTGLSSPEPQLQLAKDASPEQVRETLQRAADEAVKTRQPVFVRLGQ